MNALFKINGKKIETKRLILRAFAENDLEDFYEYASVEGVGERAGWKHHESIEESREILGRFIENDIIRYFAFYGWLGNTEMQENYFESQPIEVKPIEAVVRDWEAI
jgi:hypothetical protein